MHKSNLFTFVQDHYFFFDLSVATCYDKGMFFPTNMLPVYFSVCSFKAICWKWMDASEIVSLYVAVPSADLLCLSLAKFKQKCNDRKKE